MTRLHICLFTFWVIAQMYTLAQVSGVETDIFEAVAAGDRAAAARILEATPGAVHERRAGFLPVHLAAARGETEILQDLIKRDPALLEAKSEDGSSLISLSIMGCHTQVTSWLIEMLSKDKRNSVLQTEVQVVLMSYPRSLKVFIDAGWRPQSREDLLNLIGWSLYLDDLDLLKKLQPLGLVQALVDDKKEKSFLVAALDKRTALTRFLETRQAIETIPYLLQCVLKEAPEEDWGTDIKEAAFCLVQKNDVSALVPLFDSRRLELNGVDSDGRSLWQVANDWRAKKIVQWLVCHGAKEILEMREMKPH